MRFLSVFSVLFLVRLSSCDEVVFDLSSPDPSLARDYESTVDGVVHHSFFPKGQLFSKVVDGGVTLWEAEGEERCDVLFTSVCDRTRAVLHVWVKGLPSKTLHYENVSGEWKLVTVRVKGLPELEEPVSPKEHTAELNFASLGCPLQGFSGSEAHVENPKLVAEDVEPQDDKDLLEAPAEEPENLPDAIVEEAPEVNVEELGEVEALPETKVEEPETPVEYFSELQSEVLPEVPVEPTIEPEVSIPEESNNDEEDPRVAPAESSPSPGDSEKESEDVQPEENELRSNEVKESESVPTHTEEVSPKSEEPVSHFLDKVHESLFNVENGEENGLNLIKLTAKEGVKADRLTFDGQTVWEDKKKFCSSAVLYLDGDQPTLAVLVTRDKNNKVKKVCKHHDGNKWKNGNENKHKKKLKELRDTAKPKDAPEATKKEQEVSQGQAQANPDKPVDKDTLDISKKDNSVGKYNKTVADDKISLHTFDIDKATVTKVVDGKDVIWEAPAGTDHKCTWAELGVFGDKETLGLEIKMDKVIEINFRKIDGKWQRVQVSK
ncbi:signal peptide-containing protein [Theileria equi strain WA]|uniref:Signal peptide-containing protein n=1 Tax=Theileria equi strain WA TaxID=1537102 RepID=L0AXL1_THEEQ|nr:signal peptide-containing protein [Theileria equi strain WA]AFZ79978.1 signal peptide-containing protein [Theileria equi strain WA]|eukprot:XP_004829644.1 signal peptide-containing protein [Theileria equi strain WA]